MNGTTYPTALKTLEIRTVGEDVIVHDTEHEQIHVLNRIGGEVLALCDGTRSIESIAEQLSERTGAPLERVLADVEVAVTSYRTLGFVS